MRWDISGFGMPFDMVESRFGRWAALSSFEIDFARFVGTGSGFLCTGLLPPPLLIVSWIAGPEQADSGAKLAMLPGVMNVSSCHDSNRGSGGSARLRSTAFLDSEVEPLRCAVDSSPGSKLFLPVLLLEFLLCRELRCESCIGVSFAGDESDLALMKDSCDLAFKFARFGGTSRLCLPWEVPGLK